MARQHKPRRHAKRLLGPKMLLDHGEVRLGVPVDVRNRLRRSPSLIWWTTFSGKRLDRLARARSDEKQTRRKRQRDDMVGITEAALFKKRTVTCQQ